VALHPGQAVVESLDTAENRSVAGYIIVRANSLAEAAQLAKGCPILAGEGTSVEVREIESG
jgi:hypothetical protein